MRSSLSCLSGLMVLSAVACAEGGDDGAGGAGGEPASASSSASSASGQGGAGGSVDPGDYAGFGGVDIISREYLLGGTPVREAAIYVDYSLHPTGTDACAMTTHGPCDVRVCPLPGADPMSLRVSAGTVEVGIGAETFPIAWSNNDYEAFSAGPEQHLFDPGDAITVQAAGSSEVPAHGTALTAPSSATITTPLSDGMTIDRSAPLSLAWTGGTEQVAVAWFVVDTPGLRKIYMSCWFDAAAAGGSIPAEALASFPAGVSPDVQGGFSISSESVDFIEAGDFLVRVAASSAALTPAGEWAQAANVAFE